MNGRCALPILSLLGVTGVSQQKSHAGLARHLTGQCSPCLAEKCTAHMLLPASWVRRKLPAWHAAAAVAGTCPWAAAVCRRCCLSSASAKGQHLVGVLPPPPPPLLTTEHAGRMSVSSMPASARAALAALTAAASSQPSAYATAQRYSLGMQRHSGRE
jgi:hypothetical protein